MQRYKMIDTMELAKSITSMCRITNICLNYMLYYLKNKYLLEEDSLLFSHGFCAFKSGPVVPDVYYYFCGCGAMEIQNRYPISSFIDDKLYILIHKASLLHYYDWWQVFHNEDDPIVRDSAYYLAYNYYDDPLRSISIDLMKEKNVEWLHKVDQLIDNREVKKNG